MNAKGGVRLKVVGNTSGLDAKIQGLIHNAQENTVHNDTITVAANYGGRWDVVQDVKAWQAAHPGETVDAMDEANLAAHLGLAYAPDPDLLIRTGGESRISNFMPWQLACTELFFTDVLWPDFTPDRLNEAIDWFAQRDRRFGASGLPIASPAAQACTVGV